MRVEGYYCIPYSPDFVWESLNDPEILLRIIPNCKSFERREDNLYFTELGVKIGPVNWPLKGTIAVDSHLDENAYTLRAKGKGIIAKLGEVITFVRLEEYEMEKTRLSYSSHLKLRGKFEKLEPQWIDNKAKIVAETLFAGLIEQMHLKRGKLTPPMADDGVFFQLKKR